MKIGSYQPEKGPMDIISFSKKGAWSNSFRFEDVKCLIVCRGPIRKEALEVFEAMGVQPCGILLSEKDSLVYAKTLAPELRFISPRHERVHAITDYTGGTKEERAERIQQILEICHEHHYTHVFAGYGFMAEDPVFISAIEKAGIGFIGPHSSIVQKAGTKDEAKRLGVELGISVVPGVDNITALTLLHKAKGSPKSYLRKLIDQHGLKVDLDIENKTAEQISEQVLQASYLRQIDLISIGELQEETERQVRMIWEKHPTSRIRFKHVGGGGGKGQRIIATPDQVADAVMEVLIESQAIGVGDNKNFVIERNIEDTRHNEIQLLGNGDWCIALGGRDCSLQIHEQKLLETSLTAELLQEAAQTCQTRGLTRQAETLINDMETLEKMCKDAESFGQAIQLDSVSTFECIVDGASHYFMETNTRIQVEHRVTEMAYSLKFVNPHDSEEFFILDSLVAAMLLVACHGMRVPKPDRLPRYISGAEARINAMNAALQPHAGGVLHYWSPPVEGELRDDQGIGILNPDTQLFQHYQLAGGYDANVALVVCAGRSRLENLRRLAESLRRMEVRGENVRLNIDFHYGLLHWLIGNDVMSKTNTRFVLSYLAMTGKLVEIVAPLNLTMAWKFLQNSVRESAGKEGQSVLDSKSNLILRPLGRMLENAHLLVGWLASGFQNQFFYENKRFQWRVNPLKILHDLYHYLRLEERPHVPAAHKIWPEDQQLLETGLAFYEELRIRLGDPEMPWSRLEALLMQSNSPPQFFPAPQWNEIRMCHRGFQLGMDLLKLPLLIARKAQYFEFRCNEDLTIEIPSSYKDLKEINRLIQNLAPTPPASGYEIFGWSGGTFYTKETPNAPPYVQVGDHFEKGDTLGILEVMKMFNPIIAEFSGTIKKVVVDGNSGVVVRRGQVLFEVEPDTPPTHTSAEEIRTRQLRHTRHLMACLIPSLQSANTYKKRQH